MKKRIVFAAVLIAVYAGAMAFFPESALATPSAGGSDMTKIYITLGILGIASFLFFTELIPLAVTAILVPCALSILGVISVKEAWIGFGDTAILTVIGLFILGNTTFSTGFSQAAANALIKKFGTGEFKLLIVSIIVIGLMSAFLSNAGTTAITLPLLLALSRSSKICPSRILIPTAFAASLGGTLTMVGTVPNMVANSLLLQMVPEHRTIGFFEFGYIGLPFFVTAILMYVLFGKWLLPTDKNNADAASEDSGLNLDNIRHPEKKWWSAVIFVGVIICMATDQIPLTSAAMLGAMLAVLTGCITMKEAYESVDWGTIFLFAGMLAMSHAMDKSGTALLISRQLIEYIKSPELLLASICFITIILTNIMSNTATTAIMIPLVIPVAIQIGLSPLPFVLCVVTAASSCFLTPIATPSNTLVMAAGGYSFTDYVKYGWPLQLVGFLLCVFVIPIIWPF